MRKLPADVKRQRAAERARRWYAANPNRGKANATRWAAANEEKRVAVARKHQLKRYGLTPAAFDCLVERQNNRCAICGKTPHEAHGVNRIKHLVVDHDHHTGHVRALLCLHCNHALGSFRDNPIACRNAAAYLESHEAATGAIRS